MILKKPYAFLIKNFKFLHIILFIILSFIIYKTNKIYTFLNNYVNGNYFDFEENFRGSYIDIYIFFAIIIVIVFSVSLFLLMRLKDKNKNYYLFLGVFYFALFILFIYYFSYLGIIQTEIVDKKVLRIVRDSSFVALIPQYIFCAFALFRGLGFDLKKFNFNKDLIELDISVEDEEEFELTINSNGYKVKRNIRKNLKEMYFYFVENRQMILIVASIIVLIFLLLGYLDNKRNAKTYSEGRQFYADGFLFKITNSYLTNLNYKGQVIDSKKQYIIIKFNITNNSGTKKNIDLNGIKVNVNNKDYYPILTKYNSFIDLGKGYKRYKLDKNEKNEYIMVFKIDKDVESNKWILKINDNMDVTKGNFYSKYINTNLKPKKSLETDLVETKNIGEEVKFVDSEISNSIFSLKTFEVKDEYNVNYKYCLKTDCYVGEKNITGNEVGEYAKAVIKLNGVLNIKETTSEINEYNKIGDFLTTFGKVEYEINGTKHVSDIKNITPNNTLNSYNYFEVREEVLDSKTINLIISIRNKEYKIKVK